MKWCARRISHVHHVKYLLCKWYVGRGEARQRSEARDISVLFGVDRWKIIGRPTIIRVGETFPHIPQRDHANFPKAQDLLGRARLPSATFASASDGKFIPRVFGPRVEFVRAAFHKLSFKR